MDLVALVLFAKIKHHHANLAQAIKRFGQQIDVIAENHGETLPVGASQQQTR